MSPSVEESKETSTKQQLEDKLSAGTLSDNNDNTYQDLAGDFIRQPKSHEMNELSEMTVSHQFRQRMSDYLTTRL